MERKPSTHGANTFFIYGIERILMRLPHEGFNQLDLI